MAQANVLSATVRAVKSARQFNPRRAAISLVIMNYNIIVTALYLE